MANQIYARREYSVIHAGRGYIVINRKKEFKDGHTHIRNYKTARYVADLAAAGRIPNDLPEYLLVSLYRISADENYRRKVEGLLHNKQNRRKSQ